MTKTEFRREAGKAGINSNLYGVTIDFPLTTREGYRVSFVKPLFSAVMVFCGPA